MTVSERLEQIEAEVNEREKLIKLKTALEYMVQLVDDRYKPTFQQIIDSAKTLEEMKRVMEVVSKQIGQQAAINLLGI